MENRDPIANMEVGLTFDDVLLIPGHSEVVPSEINTEAEFGKGIILKTPIVSSAMDTVTENRMARVLAQEGGLGIIHKNFSIEEQALEVEKVKKYESGMIVDPITLPPTAKAFEALELMRRYSISGVPVTVDGRLVGILTNRDLRFETQLDQPISNLMTKENLVTAKESVTMEEAKETLQIHRIEKLPVVDSNGVLKGLVTIKDIEKAKAFPKATKDSFGRLIVGAAIGVTGDFQDRAGALVNAGLDVLCIDTAHGHSKNVLNAVGEFSKKYPALIIMAGNVATGEGTEALIEKGADVVKVGMGSGSICTTRVIAGIGVPQITAIKNSAMAARKKGKTVIADGGIRYSGDLVKALAVGAKAVMVGNMLAGADESPGESILYQGRTFKIYRGMGSLGAMFKGSKDRYFQEGVGEFDKLVPEGIEGRVPYKGSASAIVHQLVGGIKSGMGYVGAHTIMELQEKARFVKVTSHGVRESHVHDVTITKEAPNYRLS